MTTVPGPQTINGIITNWLALTIPGPPAFRCSSLLYFLPGEVSRIVAFDPSYEKWINTSVNCVASEASLWWHQHSDGVTTDVNLGPFSCPNGFSESLINTARDNRESEYVYAGTLKPAAILGQCFSPLKLGQAIVARITANSNLNSWTDTAVSINSTTSKSVVAAHVNGFVFKAEGSTVPASASATTTQPASIPSTASIAPINTPSIVIPTETAGALTAGVTSEPLNSGANIGIGVAVSIGVIGIICFLATIILPRRRNGHRQPPFATELLTTSAPSQSKGSSFFNRNRSVLDPHRGHVYEVPGARKQESNQPQEMWVSPTHGVRRLE
ncbi:hypothetical protein BJ875DRAFT_442536 [Amylocarpus encephaloides]|uniref:Uncharacterized protein n=1 Tax=Amylocarpus encephaloides TaxID=45428 RepID=A0A9P7YGB0_9HELO|nr:hypothetical protein BJ875DRAFT_442536 [Amylocarpus encephaloides]